MGAQVSRQPPSPLPGGYTVGEQVYFTGTSQTFENGDRLVHGKQGEVAGPTPSEINHKGKYMQVRFPGNKVEINCLLNQVRRRRRHAATPAAVPTTPAAPPLSPSQTLRVPCERNR